MSKNKKKYSWFLCVYSEVYLFDAFWVLLRDFVPAGFKTQPNTERNHPIFAITSWRTKIANVLLRKRYYGYSLACFFRTACSFRVASQWRMKGHAEPSNSSPPPPSNGGMQKQNPFSILKERNFLGIRLFCRSKHFPFFAPLRGKFYLKWTCLSFSY